MKEGDQIGRNDKIQSVALCAIVLESSSLTLRSPALTLRTSSEAADVLPLTALACMTGKVRHKENE